MVMDNARAEFTRESLSWIKKSVDAELNGHAEWCASIALVYATLAAAHSNPTEVF